MDRDLGLGDLYFHLGLNCHRLTLVTSMSSSLDTHSAATRGAAVRPTPGVHIGWPTQSTALVPMLLATIAAER